MIYGELILFSWSICLTRRLFRRYAGASVVRIAGADVRGVSRRIEAPVWLASSEDDWLETRIGLRIDHKTGQLTRQRLGMSRVDNVSTNVGRSSPHVHETGSDGSQGALIVGDGRL